MLFDNIEEVKETRLSAFETNTFKDIDFTRQPGSLTRFPHYTIKVFGLPLEKVRTKKQLINFLKLNS